MYDVYSCWYDGVIVRPKRVHKQIIFILRRFCFSKKPRRRQPNEQASGPERWEGVGGGLFEGFGVLGCLEGLKFKSLRDPRQARCRRGAHFQKIDEKVGGK